jgi:hypothetical protein
VINLNSGVTRKVKHRQTIDEDLLAAVMRTMGHRDVKTAMQYQHPELAIVRAALDQDTAVEKPA